MVQILTVVRTMRKAKMLPCHTTKRNRCVAPRGG